MNHETKKCSRCDVVLVPGENITEYRYNDRERRCRDCMQSERVEKTRGLKQKAIEYKGGKCEDCGGVFHRRAYDFHHLNPEEKEGKLTQMFRSRKWEYILPELDKCVLLCANCHRIRHSEDEL